MVNPLNVTLPLTPLIVTISPAVELPDSSIKVVAAPAPVTVRGMPIVICSLYVPAHTSITSFSAAALMAACIVA